MKKGPRLSPRAQWRGFGERTLAVGPNLPTGGRSERTDGYFAFATNTFALTESAM
jgi:hypothetical protein